jgi:Dipeptidyl aminopeptidases/acylaminoacyl-peptidases
MQTSTGKFAAAVALFLFALPLRAQQIPAAVYTDPAHDLKHPARTEVLHIPSADLKINGLEYVAAGGGVHPTFVLLHGLPGNEKNLDLAQAVRRAGWNVITFNYRGSWGSPGVFRFAQNFEDAAAVLSFLREPANASALGIDTTRIVLAGHSMGGWITIHVAAKDHRLRGAVLISASDMSRFSSGSQTEVSAHMSGLMESLAGTTPEQMTDEIRAHGSAWAFSGDYDGLAAVPMLVITSNDGRAPSNDSLVAAVRARGNRNVVARHFDTDHSYNDERIALESAVILWLQKIAKELPAQERKGESR